MHSLYKKNSGFTLIELITTLLIGALLLAWGVPGYRGLKVSRLVTDHANEMVYSLSLARAEAIRYGSTVTVSPLSGNDWNSGWLISAPGIEGGADIEIYQQSPLDSKLNITQNGPLQGDLQFNNIGELVGNNQGQFTIAHTVSTNTSRNILINLAGMSKVVNP
ncbi:MAG: GspH/FimT family pseudopilin [Marinicella sp.]